MATTHKMSYHDLGALIRNVGTYAQEAQKQAVFNAALHMRQVITREVHKDLGGKDYFRQMEMKKSRSGKFMGVRPETNRVGVRFDMKGEYSPTALLTAYGPMGLLEYGAPPHEINARLIAPTSVKGAAAKKRARVQRELNIVFGGRGAFAGSRQLRTPYGARYRVLNHPGMRPKKTFSKAVDKATPKATEIATSLIQSKTIQRLRTQYGSFTYVLNEPGVFRPVVG